MNSLKFFIFALFCSSICFGLDESAVLFEKSVELYSSKRFEESIQILKSLINKDPKKSVYLFNLGNNYFMLSKYDLALRNYDKVIELNGTFVSAARLYKVKTLRRLGLLDSAQNELNLLLSTQLSEGLFKEANSELQYLLKIRTSEENALELYQNENFKDSEMILRSITEEDLSQDGKLLYALILIRNSKHNEAFRSLNQLIKNPFLSSEKKKIVTELIGNSSVEQKEALPYWIFLDSSFGTTDNIYQDGKSIPAVSSVLMREYLGLGYVFNENKSFSEKVSYNFNTEVPSKAQDLKTTTHLFTASLIYNYFDFNVSVSPSLQQQIWNKDSVSQKTGCLFKMNNSFNYFETGIEYSFHTQKALHPDYKYLAGAGYFYKPFVGWWNESIYTQFYLLLGADGTRDQVYSDGSSLPLSYAHQGLGIRGAVKYKDNYKFTFGLSNTQRKYKNLELLSQKERYDSENSFYFKISYLVITHLNIYGMGEYNSNRSTFSYGDSVDKNINSTIFTIGLLWDVFE